jgi:hypothetical protein
MNEVWNVIAGEFADLPSVAEVVRVTMRLLMAAILGGILGYEREQQGKNAGLRTLRNLCFVLRAERLRSCPVGWRRGARSIDSR